MRFEFFVSIRFILNKLYSGTRIVVALIHVLFHGWCLGAFAFVVVFIRFLFSQLVLALTFLVTLICVLFLSLSITCMCLRLS